MKKNFLEWTVFGLSAALILGVLGWLVYDGLTPKRTTPDIRLSLGEAEKLAEGHALPIEVRNAGDVTAEGVMIEVKLTPKSGEEATSSFEIQFLPRQSSREGWVVFEDDPDEAVKLEARVLGFEKP